MPALRCRSTCLLALGVATMALSAEPPANYDEDKIPAYVLPDPLVMQNGTPVTDAATWQERRRLELLQLLADNEYGRTPAGRPTEMHWKTRVIDHGALGGKATLKEITVWFSSGETSQPMQLLVFQPNHAPAPCPVFLGLNFYGNHTVHADPRIALPSSWVPNDGKYGIKDHRPVAAMRGSSAEQWQVERVVARGYAVATVYCGDLCPDYPEGLAQGLAARFSAKPGAEERPGDAWGAVGVWAWGLSRALDVLAEDPELDARRVAVHGHSRLGKAALWAGAQDERFALVISNESGCGGAALSKRIFGETVGAINRQFPHWFARNFRRFNEREADLPFDQHELLALIAPRPLYVASAEGDRWADPRGEFLAARATGPVYALFGRAGLGVEAMPAIAQPVGEAVRYHIRPGPHDITEYDWMQYLDFADRWLAKH
jgi:hypothetical protein